jgi:hypothetical protein
LVQLFYKTFDHVTIFEIRSFKILSFLWGTNF